MLTNDDKRLIRQTYGKDNLFKMLYKALFTLNENELSPEEVWSEAGKAVVQIGEADEMARDIEVQAVYADLCRQYGETGMVCVMKIMLAAFFMLLDRHDSADEHPHKEVCIEMKRLLKTMPGFEELYEKCRTEEDKLEADGKFIEVVDYLERFMDEPMKEASAHDDVIYRIIEEAKKFDVDAMRNVEMLLARVNDQTDHKFQMLLDDFRQTIDEKVANQNLPTTVNTQGGPLIMDSTLQAGVEFNAQKSIEAK
ncbi:MAG: hypothetical protein IKK07_05265 [Bacteroides sp.]|nr:hypothetical protein [Bacteroides sp.]